MGGESRYQEGGTRVIATQKKQNNEPVFNVSVKS